MDSRFVRLRAMVVLAALVGVPLVAVLGTRPWSGKATPLDASTGDSSTSNAAALAGRPFACDEPSGIRKEGGAANPAAQPPELALGQAKSPELDGDASTPRAAIRGVRAASKTDPLAGAERAEASGGGGRALHQVWQLAQQRLEALGAVNWRLETWGSEGLYRFSCAVSLAGQSRSTRYFEAVAARPERAIERVVSEVEAFRAGQLTTATGRTPLRR